MEGCRDVITTMALQNIITGCITAAFTPIAFLPQVYKVWKMRTAEGLNPVTNLFTNIAQLLKFCNGITLKWKQLDHCRTDVTLPMSSC
jgi:uncharacterized protein with PQ loop repeat